jgi:hypothetical protein
VGELAATPQGELVEDGLVVGSVPEGSTILLADVRGGSGEPVCADCTAAAEEQR